MYYRATAALVMAMERVREERYGFSPARDNTDYPWLTMADLTRFEELSGEKKLDLRTVIFIAEQEDLIVGDARFFRLTQKGADLVQQIYDEMDEEKESRKAAMAAY